LEEQAHNQGGVNMFREKLKSGEIKVSHELSARINMKRSGKISRFDNEAIDSKIEMKYAG
jgi:hypothetical protein